MFHDLLNLLYPRFCQSCESVLLTNESVLCTKCIHHLPLLWNHEDNENDSKKVFYGRLNIENATSLLRFENKGRVQQLIHKLKYGRQEEIGEFFGKWLGGELKELKSYKEITAVVPVPLHKVKLRSRGYNQVEKFGKEIAKALEVPYIDNVLVKKSASKSQTLKSRLARWGSIDETFTIEHPELLENSHILLVDDLITTGATLEACAGKLMSIPNIKISLASMAITV